MCLVYSLALLFLFTNFSPLQHSYHTFLCLYSLAGTLQFVFYYNYFPEFESKNFLMVNGFCQALFVAMGVCYCFSVIKRVLNACKRGIRTGRRNAKRMELVK